MIGALALATLATLAVAQDYPSTASGAGAAATITSSPSSTLSTATRTASSAAATWTIAVGKGDHKFTPEVVQALPGDWIDFNFYPTNHSVVRAEYEYPCIPYEMTGRGKVGFFSGFRPVDAILDEPPSYKIRINDTNPIFFYCSAVGSCIDWQMVGVINPNASVSLQRQKEIARDSKYMLQPGQSFPDEAASSSMASLTSYPTSTSTAAGSAATSSGAAATSPKSGGLSAGAIAGIAIGGAVVLIMAAALFFYMGRTKQLKETVRRNSTTFPPEGPGGPGMQQMDAAGMFVQKQDFRNSHMTTSTYAVPAYETKEGYPDGSMSPRSYNASPSPRAPFQEFGGVYQAPIDRPLSAEVDGSAYRPPQHGSPVEMYAPLR